MERSHAFVFQCVDSLGVWAPLYVGRALADGSTVECPQGHLLVRRGGLWRYVPRPPRHLA